MKKIQPFLMIAATLMLGLTVFGQAGQVLAAALPAQAITMSPTSVDQSVQPSSVNTGSFQIINSGDTDYTFHVYATPFGVTDETYTPDFTALPGRPDVTKWFKFSSSGGSIAAHQTVTVNYTITVPANAIPKGYYAVAFAQTQSLPSKTTGVVITERVGEIFYLRVAGNAQQGGSLLSWQASLLQRPPLTATVRIEDTGAYNFPATINAQVKNIFGHTVYKFNTTRQILPQTIRRITVPWQSSPSIGIFKISGSASFLGQNHQLPTKYIIVASTPVRLIILAIIALWIIAFAYRWYKQRRDKARRRPLV